MRLLLLLDSYQEDEVGTIVFRLCQRISPLRELIISTIAFGPDGPLAERLQSLGVGTRRIPERGLRHFSTLQQLGKATLYKADRPDVIQSHCRWPDVTARLFHGGHPNVPLLTSVNTLDDTQVEKGIDKLLAPWVEKFTRKNCTKIITASEAIRQRFLQRHIPARMLRTINLGINGVQLHPISEASQAKVRMLLGVQEDEPLIVFTGRVSAHLEPNARLMLSAFLELRKNYPTARLFYIGCTFSPTFTRAVEATGGAARVIGPLAEILPRIHGTADLVVRSTIPGAFPTGTAEAMAIGVPVVAFIDGRSKEFTAGAGPGVYTTTDPNDVLRGATLIDHARQRSDVSPLLGALRRFLTNPTDALSQAAENREFLLENYELSDTVEKYLQLWREFSPDATWAATDSMPLTDLDELQIDAESR